jgi:hypothetical protein
MIMPSNTVDKITRFQQQMAELREAVTIPRWARVALAVRTVRRVQPFVQAAWPKTPKGFLRAIEAALDEAEFAATQGTVTPDQTRIGMAAMDAYAKRPIDVGAAGDIVFAAAHASFAARGPTADHALFVIEQAIHAVFGHEICEPRGFQKATLKAVWTDLRHLKSVSKTEGWDNKTPVPSDVFGPMWPNGPPQDWPAIVPPVRTPSSRKRTARPKVHRLGLPSDCVQFLQAGRNLEYDPSTAECGLVVLKPYTHLRPGECRIGTEGTVIHSRDPNRGKHGEYLVKTVELVGECDAYDPDGILTWFPDFRSFGCWDVDHHTALIFTNTKWSDIVESPAEYLSAQWSCPEFAMPMAPWKHGKFEERE